FAGTVSYSNGPSTYPAICTVTQANVTMSCVAAAGAGTGFTWTVSPTSGTSASFAATTSYQLPVVFSVVAVGISNGQFSTGGGGGFVVHGDYFGGSIGGVQSVAYGPYTATGCTMTTAHTELLCNTVAGVGRDYAVQVRVGGQTSAASTDK